MSLAQMISARASKDTLVYWGSPNPQADGSMAYAAPVEINCVWHECSELFISKDGKETVSRAKVYVTQDIDDQGMVYHGELTDLTAGQQADPLIVETAFEIKKFEKIPSLIKPSEYLRYVML